MIEGIDYYPKRGRKNNKSKIKLGVVIFMLTLLAFYFSFDDSQTPKASQTNLIVIKEAEVKKTQVVITPINDEIGDIQAKPKQPEILENLDEINQER